ncbi:hypothetical protein BS17DRAFT_780442 [Gyrodon lividus]|nr:hypothetical protein BS17DRAFT_780442 [Gyrodon lividus]
MCQVRHHYKLTPAPDNQAMLKRCIAALEEKNTNLLSKLEHSESIVLEGRAIRRLVSLVDHVEDLLAKYGRCVMLGARNDPDAQSIPSSEVEQHQYRSYQKLTCWCPLIWKLIQNNMDAYQLSMTYCQLNQGADGARSDDASKLKVTVAAWLMDVKSGFFPGIPGMSGGAEKAGFCGNS